MSSRAFRPRFSLFFAPALFGLAIGACATGETLDETGVEGVGAAGGGGSAGSGGGAQRDASSSGFPDAARDSGTSSFPDAARIDASSDASREGGAGGSGGSGGSGGAGGTVPCTTGNACSSSTNIGSVSGDRGSDHLSVSGTSGQWVQFRVTEDDSGVTSRTVRAFVTLISPPGTNFDLYLRSGDGSPACGAIEDQSTSASGNDTASVSRDDSGLFGLSNGSDDTFWATAEVRWVSGPCAPGSKWTLTVDGN